MDKVIWSNGLDEVVAAHTALSMVDGANGRLVIAGQELHTLAGQASYEQALGLLFAQPFAPLNEAHSLPALLGGARERAHAAMPLASTHWRQLGATEAVRALMATLEDGHTLSAALCLAAAPAVALGAWLRVRAGQEPVAPDATQSHAADLLRMAGLNHGAAPNAALNAYLVTVCDHGLNASTFAARVVASTHAGLGSAVLAGISALKGPLHGGAPGPVLDMLDAIATPANAQAWLQAALERGERLMGFGHRIYRVRDPRADALKRALTALASHMPQAAAGGRIELAQAVERAALALLAQRKPGRALDINVEFYTALLLDALGFPREAFTAVFAAGRVLGWLAHAQEQVRFGRLIRPQSVYVGQQPAELALET